MSEEQAILDEITEEIKHDQFVQFVRKHQTPISAVVLCSIAGIVMYTSWNSRLKKELSENTQALMQIGSDIQKNRMVLDSMIKNAPSKLVPIVEIVKAGLYLSSSTPPEERAKINEMLLDLSRRNGVEQEWKDLAALIYVANSDSTDYKKLISILEPISGDDRPFHLSAKELLGVLHMALGNSKEAASFFDKVISHPNVSHTMADRCKMLKRRI